MLSFSDTRRELAAGSCSGAARCGGGRRATQRGNPHERHRRRRGRGGTCLPQVAPSERCASRRRPYPAPRRALLGAVRLARLRGVLVPGRAGPARAALATAARGTVGARGTRVLERVAGGLRLVLQTPLALGDPLQLLHVLLQGAGAAALVDDLPRL